MLSVAEAAKRLGVKQGLVYQLCTSRRLRHCKIGNGRGVIRIPEDALDEYVRSVTFGTEEAGATPPPEKAKGKKITSRFFRL